MLGESCRLRLRGSGDSVYQTTRFAKPQAAQHCNPSPPTQPRDAVRTVTLAAWPSRCSAFASVTIACASFAKPRSVYRSTLARLRNSYTLIPLVNRAVVFVGRQWLGPAT